MRSDSRVKGIDRVPLFAIVGRGAAGKSKR